MEIDRLATETRNPRTTDLDAMSVSQVLRAMNDEDRSVPDAVGRALPAIERAVDLIADALRRGGRLVYVGAGTSGRLGLLDAVECPPTFDTDPGQVTALIAGGDRAVTDAVEGAEDDTDLARADIDDAGVGELDAVVGLAASGRTPYVVAALDRARERGAATVSVACNTDAVISGHADVAIEVDTGPEVLTGSTRLKAGTAQKLVCNMLSTAAMVRIGKTYHNLMVDMRPTNAKLADRARRIVATAAGVDAQRADAALEAAQGRTKVATLMALTSTSADEATVLLERADGSVRQAVDLADR